MKYILLIAGLVLASIGKSSIKPDDILWFSANEIGTTGYGSVPSMSIGSAADFDDNPPLAGQPPIALDPEVGECLQNSDRICAAKFITDTDDVTPLTLVTSQIVQGEFRYR